MNPLSVSRRTAISRSGFAAFALLVGLFAGGAESGRAQVTGSAAATTWFDPNFGDATEVGPGLTVGVSVRSDRALSFGMELAFARLDFPVRDDQLHRNHGGVILSTRLMPGARNARIGVTAGLGALFWDDLSETDPGFQSSANAEELFVPGLLLRFPVAETWGIEAFAQDFMSGWFWAILDPSEGAVIHRFVVGAGIYFR